MNKGLNFFHIILELKKLHINKYGPVFAFLEKLKLILIEPSYISEINFPY